MCVIVMFDDNNLIHDSLLNSFYMVKASVMQLEKVEGTCLGLSNPRGE